MSVSLRTFGPWRGMGGSATWPPTEPEPDPPEFTGNLSPNNGPASGGTTSMIPGNHFLGATGVLYGTTEAPFFNVVSEHQIECESPPYPNWTSMVGVNITILHPVGNATRNSAFVYTSASEDTDE